MICALYLFDPVIFNKTDKFLVNPFLILVSWIILFKTTGIIKILFIAQENG